MAKEKGISKTPPMRALEAAGVPYQVHIHARKQYTAEGVAEDLKVPLAWVVKAMIVQRSDGRFALFVVPGDKRLSMKKAAAALNDKGASLAPEREVLRATGYQVGSVSVTGFRRDDIPGFIDQSVMAAERIIISAGRPDAGIEMSPADLPKIIPNAQLGDYCEG
ncbi:MAG: YbaK/EbsC family protein [Anaerolineae bacterium]|nr:YbaK/EbsC family protein [Anaerolineae bacterium]